MDPEERSNRGLGGLAVDLLRWPVTGSVVLAAVVASVAYWTGSGIERFVMVPDRVLEEPWRLLTSALPHADLLHLGFNAYWTWRFGRWVETNLGGARTAALLALFAAGSAAAEVALFDGGIGLSGVGYGLCGLLFVLDRRDPRFRGALTRGDAGLFALWFVLCIALTRAGVWSVANVAHGAGAVLGVLAGQAMCARGVGALGWRATLAATLLGTLGLATTGRTYVNLGSGRAADLFEQAYAASEAEDHLAAVELYTASLEEDGTYAGTWYNLGLALRELERYGEALQVLDRAAVLDPFDADTHSVRGLTLGDLGRFDEAVVALNRGAVLAPDDGFAHGNLGWCLWEAGRRDEAIEALDRAIECDPDDVWALERQAHYLVLLDRHADALRAAERALELDPENAEVRFLQGRCLRALGREREARQVLSEALELVPEDR